MINRKNLITTAFLILIFGLSVLLRMLFVKYGSILFSYDQARDAFMAKEIIAGDLKIMGPPASILQGLSHGVIWYYLLAIFYSIGQGSPIVAAYSYGVVVSLSIFSIFLLSKTLSGNGKIGLVSALLWAVSFEGIQYSTWLSNPSLAFIFTPLIYLFLWLWIEKKKSIYALAAGIFLGLSVQANLFLIYHLISIAILLLINRVKILSKHSLLFVVAFLVSISTLILEQIKFGFAGIKGVVFLLSGTDKFVSSTGFGDFLINYLNQIGTVFSNNLFPYNHAFGGLLGTIVVVLTIKKLIQDEKRHNWTLYILVFMFSQIIISMFGGMSTPYIGVGLGVAIIILTTNLIFSIKSSVVKILTILFFVCIGISTVFTKADKSIFAIQEEMRIDITQELIDYTYQESNGEKFSINTVTAPLWVNTTWSYLYKWYGMEKYGYLPNFIGRDQIGQIDQLGSGKPEKTIYLIIEPSIAIPQRYIDATIAEENARSKVLEEKNWKTLIVQKRILK